MCFGFLNVISPKQSPLHGQPPHMALKTFDIASKPCPPDGDINVIDTQRQRKKEAKHDRNRKCTKKKQRNQRERIAGGVRSVF